MKYHALALSILLSLAAAEVPQEHSHEKYLVAVNQLLKQDNPLNIQDAVFGLLGNAAASAGAGDVANLDCLHQNTADSAFSAAKAAGDVDGMAAALVFRAVERNTGSVGLRSVLCEETAANPEIGALSQHQDPAAEGAAQENKEITLELARQLAGVGADPLLALDAGTFEPGDVNDATGAGNTCDDTDDPEGCIFTKGLLVEDATPEEIQAAVADVAAGAGGDADAGAGCDGGSGNFTAVAKRRLRRSIGSSFKTRRFAARRGSAGKAANATSVADKFRRGSGNANANGNNADANGNGDANNNQNQNQNQNGNENQNSVDTGNNNANDGDGNVDDSNGNADEVVGDDTGNNNGNANDIADDTAGNGNANNQNQNGNQNNNQNNNADNQNQNGNRNNNGNANDVLDDTTGDADNQNQNGKQNQNNNNGNVNDVVDDTNGADGNNQNSGNGNDNGNDNGNAATGTDVQSFTGTLGGAAPPVTSSDSDKPFEVNGATFLNAGAALQRSCAVQHNACANAANSGSEDISVADCDAQEDDCLAAASLTKLRRSSSVGSAGRRMRIASNVVKSRRRQQQQQQALDFGECRDPSIQFAAGLDGRAEGSFGPAGDFEHGSALNINIISSFICGQLSSRCQAADEAVAACEEGQADAQGLQGQDAADAFNSALGL
ncbi:hypothetical protein CTRI78_v006123 [Colletotrichum trifolii]|uniref:Circumsporozoite protein n=1 Tax=Colletotrichum trifolii TaxID=5466 RepID=A0A4R8RD49_COLTR|nr:hypothetical protein CTRI78_v006123 [Colletotrichum trifolii]